MTDIDRLKREIENIKAEIALMTAENFALELVLKHFVKRVTVAGFYTQLTQAFDDASKEAEEMHVASGHARETIRIIEQMRSMAWPHPS